MSGSITIWPRREVSETPTDWIPALNDLGNPTARIDELAVGVQELVEADVLEIADTVPPPVYVTFTTVADHAIGPYTSVVLGTKTGFTGLLIGDRVISSQPYHYFQIDVQCLANGIATIIARNFTTAGGTIPAGTAFSLLKI